MKVDLKRKKTQLKPFTDKKKPDVHDIRKTQKVIKLSESNFKAKEKHNSSLSDTRKNLMSAIYKKMQKIRKHNESSLKEEGKHTIQTF